MDRLWLSVWWTYEQQDSFCIQMSDKDSIQTKAGVQEPQLDRLPVRGPVWVNVDGPVAPAQWRRYNQVKLVPSDTPVKSQ